MYAGRNGPPCEDCAGNAGITAKDAEEYVQIILSEGALTDTDKVRGANPADLQAQLDALRKQKK